MTQSLKVLVTGAFGNVGSHAVKHLFDQGHSVVALDVKSPHNEAREAELTRLHPLETSWTDLTDLDAVAQMMQRVQPDVVLHLAAIIAPTAYVIPDKAYAVNVTGTNNIIEAAKALGSPPRVVFTSSYSVHGPRNPYRELPPITSQTPVNPGDNYGAHKVWGERAVQSSGLEWVVVRLPQVWPTDPAFGTAPEFMRFSFLLSPDRLVTAIDSRDAALALVNAASRDVANRTFIVGGGAGWSGRAGELQAKMFRARGLKPFPDEAYRQADPDVDSSWYYEGIVDTSESQEALQYQVHSPQDYYDAVKTTGVAGLFIPLLKGVIQKRLLKSSDYWGKPAVPDSEEIWVRICQTFGTNPDTRDIL